MKSKHIKSYTDFSVNEENKMKKFLLGTAIAASTLGTSNQVSAKDKDRIEISNHYTIRGNIEVRSEIIKKSKSEIHFKATFKNNSKDTIHYILFRVNIIDKDGNEIKLIEKRDCEFRLYPSGFELPDRVIKPGETCNWTFTIEDRWVKNNLRKADKLNIEIRHIETNSSVRWQEQEREKEDSYRKAKEHMRKYQEEGKKALEELRKEKEKLDLGLITKEEYEKTKERLQSIIKNTPQGDYR